jgi:hypothetical protein
MTQQLDVAISHLETMVERVTNSDKAIPDQDGDYFIETEHGGLTCTLLVGLRGFVPPTFGPPDRCTPNP